MISSVTKNSADWAACIISVATRSIIIAIPMAAARPKSIKSSKKDGVQYENNVCAGAKIYTANTLIFSVWTMKKRK